MFKTMRRITRNNVLPLYLALIICLVLSGCQTLIADDNATLPKASFDSTPPVSATEHNLSDSASSPDSSQTALDTAPEPQTYTKSATLLAVGDIMMHTPQFPSYYDKQTDRYHFDSYFEHVQPLLAEGDFVWANLETPLGGADLKYTGYPMFNAPPELAESLQYAGFNIVTTANNAYDRKELGVIRTLERLHELGMVTKGTAASAEEAKQLTIMTKNEIHMGILAYTYGTNGLIVPADKSYLVSRIHQQQMLEDIQTLKLAGADVVVIALHFGIEYQRETNSEQQTLARTLIAAGADIILGSHPHVLQPLEKVQVMNTDGTTRDGFIIYSLGNFISNMRDEYTDYGGIFEATIHKTFPDQQVVITDVNVIPTWVEITGKGDHRRYTVLPVQKTILEQKLTLSPQIYKNLSTKLAVLNEHLHSLPAVKTSAESTTSS